MGNIKMKICNVILASDESNGIGLSKCDRAVTLPWSLDNEFGYFKQMTEHSPIHPSPYIWTIISKSTKNAPEAPKNSEVILSSDYSLNEVFELANSEKWRNKIRRIFVLGGVPIYNTCFQQTAIPTRIFWTRIKFDSGADRRVEKLDDQIWKRIAPSSVKDLPVLHGKHSETDNISGQVLNYEVQIFQNFAGTDFSRSSA